MASFGSILVFGILWSLPVSFVLRVLTSFFDFGFFGSIYFDFGRWVEGRVGLDAWVPWRGSAAQDRSVEG